MGILTRFTDGLVNALTGAGTTTDPRSFNRYHVRRMSFADIEASYRGGWVMRKIVDKPAKEMVREWRNWQADAADVDKLEAMERKLDLRNKIRRAEVLRGLGGAGMVLWVGNDDPTQPLDPANITVGALRSIHVWHRSRFSLGEMRTDPADPWYGYPQYYQLNTRAAGAQVEIHPSRVIAFRANDVPDMVGGTWEEAFWGDSTVEVVLDAVANVDTSQNGFAALIKDARNRRLSVPELTRRVATADGEAQMAKRVAAMAMGESMFGVTFLDGGSAKDGSGGEKLEDRQMVWAGIPQVADMYMTAAAGAADMPATVLWGKSPDGMNATGDSDKEIWEQTINGRQELDLKPCLDLLDAIMIPSTLGRSADGKVVDGKTTGAIWWEFAPLSTMSEKDEATTFWNTMQGLQILATSGLVPTIALEKGVQNLLGERAWLPGIDTALSELDEDERFPSLTAPDPETDANGNPIDPSAITEPGNGGKEVITSSAGGGASQSPARRAANDALKAAGLSDAAIDDVMAMIDAEGVTEE